jgi:hypothetical protein
MRKTTILAALGLTALLAGAGPASAAEDACQLIKLADLPATRTALGVTIPANLDGVPVPFLVDTGVVFSLVSPAITARLGLKVADMAGVQVGGAPARKTEIRNFVMGGATAGAIDLLVADLSGVAPEQTGVLGQNLLGVTDVEYDLAAGAVRLFQSQSCGTASRAYWSPNMHTAEIVTLRSGSLLLEAEASGNGKPLHVRFDTSVPVSVLSMAAAVRTGIAPVLAGATDAPPVVVGLRQAKSWSVPVESFRLGDDTQTKPRLRVADVNLPTGVDMLIGADFFATHRIYVAKDRRRIEFTDVR